MSIPSYVQGFPQDGSSLGNTRVQIRNNLDGTFLTLGVDHINNNGNPNAGTPGYHNVIHFQDQGNSIPATVANVTQAYTGTDSHSIQQVKFMSNAGNVYKQTTMLDAYYAKFGDPLATNTAGWTYLPGGLIMNYGYTGNGASVVVDFTALGLPSFSNINYIINVTPLVNHTTFHTSGPTTSQFTILAGGTVTPTNSYYWTAIGKPA